MTIREERSTWFRKLCMKIVFDLFSGMRKGCIKIVMPEGEVRYFGQPNVEASATIFVQHYRFFSRLVVDTGIGLGEGYIAEDWDSPDPAAVVRLFIRNKAYLKSKTFGLGWIGNFAHNLRHKKRANSIKNSKKNIEEHYDLSNEFFRTFLDDSMTYSCAYFYDEAETLFDAQQNKLALIVEKARIGSEDHVLEIGCGWGSFAIKAASETGCRVTCLTLSKEQKVFAQKRIDAAGLSDCVEIKLQDYRHETGKYDRIVSIEMLEAVGQEYLGEFFKRCDELLKPNGLVVIQSITIPDRRYDEYTKGCDFVQKHIFPGGHLPSLEILASEIRKNSEFFIESVENLGTQYAKTLQHWKTRFLRASSEIDALGFDRLFRRKWEYYFAYCEATFAERYMNDLQMILTRVGNSNLEQKGSFRVSEKQLTLPEILSV